MARSITEIQKEMIDLLQADAVLSTVATNTSKTALWRLWIRIVATCAWTVEKLMDNFKQEVNETVELLKPHTLRWYAAKAEAFQFGRALAVDSDLFDNTNVPDEDVETEKIVKYAAVIEVDGHLLVKVAKEEGSDLKPLNEAEKAAFKAYMNEIKDAGVPLQIESNEADALQLHLKIYYDPLVLSANGSRNDGRESTPVKKAVNLFLKNLPFNGTFVLAYLVDALQKVEGIVVPHIVRCEVKYGTRQWENVEVKYIPDSGYLRVADGDLTISYEAQTQLK